MLATLFLALTMSSGVSADCRACHDGSKAPAMGTGHVVEVEYATVSAAKPGSLHAANTPSGFGGTIAADLLVNGKIECQTCHLDHSVPTDNRFRLRAQILPLCRSCHILQ